MTSRMWRKSPWTSPRELWHPSYSIAHEFDFSAPTTDQDGESVWDFWEAHQDEHGNSVVYGSDTATWTRHRQRDGEEVTLADRYWQPDEVAAEGPITNYFWPLAYNLPVGERLAAWRMRNMAVCLVKVGDLYGVGLTGAGMDLSWQLAYGAICAGFLPWIGLAISQGSDASTWQYGLSALGSQRARAVRAALRHHLKSERQHILHRLRSIEGWK